MEVTYHDRGEASAVTLDGACADRVPELLRELLAGATAPVRLIGTEATIQALREEGRAAELIFAEPLPLEVGTRGPQEIDRVIVPLEHPSFVGSDEYPSVTLMLGAGEYRTGPPSNPAGLPLARELETCLTSG